MKRPVCRTRSGVAAVLAMLFLVLFSTLAVGFYAASNAASQVSNNEKHAAIAAVAAESGMDFMRYQLSQVTIPHGTQQSQLFGLVYNQISANLANTPNFSGKSISNSGGVISMPSFGYITLNSNGAKFSATITDMGQKLSVKVVGVGAGSSLSRAIQMQYGLAEKSSAIFNYGVASKGKIYTQGSSRIKGATDPTKGSVLSTSMTDPTPVIIKGKEVSGDISVSNPNASVLVAGASVGGTTNTQEIYAKHVHIGVDPPEFPTVDTAAFQAYVSNAPYVAGRSLYVNQRIPAGTNPTFTGGVTIQGVLEIEYPNIVKFAGNATIQGTIIVKNGAPTDVVNNSITFTGDVSASGVETLPSGFGGLRSLTGSFLLAPGFSTTFKGNFHTVDGSIMASKIAMTGNAGGTVNGTVINLDNYEMDVSGSSEIIIASTGTTNYPAGVFFSSNYAPLPDTYEEVQP